MAVQHIKTGEPYMVIRMGHRILVPKTRLVDSRTGTFEILPHQWVEPGGMVISTDDIEKYCRATRNTYRIEKYTPAAAG